MSVTRKIIDGARSGLNSLLDRVSADGEPLTGIERDELDAELERRALARKGGARAPRDNPRARWAGAGEEAARRRREQAEARARRVHASRAAKKRAEKAAQEEAWRRFQAEARRSGASAGSGPRRGSSTSSSSRAGGGRPLSGLGRDDKIARHYKTLDLPYGADFAQVKAAYRKLMRKYHPDLHNQSPQKHKAATELTMQVTQAYNELEAYLSKK
ncbi:MAG TPA: J domain-containing protein [Kofleriaceae bacterium]|nr:J domain-containing protein [Kofleriaceae bacterium]